MKSTPKKFTPPKKPPAKAANSGIFSKSGAGQKRDAQVNSAQDKAILRGAMHVPKKKDIPSGRRGNVSKAMKY